LKALRRRAIGGQKRPIVDVIRSDCPSHGFPPA
jgi:hypothetical protein